MTETRRLSTLYERKNGQLCHKIFSDHLFDRRDEPDNERVWPALPGDPHPKIVGGGRFSDNDRDDDRSGDSDGR